MRVAVYAESATAGSLEECVITLNGTTSVPVSNADMENDEVSNILAVSFLDGDVAAGNVTIGNTGSKKAVVVITAGLSTAGMAFPNDADKRAYEDEVSLIANGNGKGNAHIGLLGYDENGDWGRRSHPIQRFHGDSIR